MSWAEFFTSRLPHIYFVYGLAFFLLGVAVALEIGRTEPTRFSRAMWPLAVFGLVHGSHEWIEMFAIIGREMYDFQPQAGFKILRLTLLFVSFVSLILFGVQLLRPRHGTRFLAGWVVAGATFFYGLGTIWLGQWLNWQSAQWLAAADALLRYSLAIPGAVLAVWAILSQRRAFLRLGQPAFANDLVGVAGAMLIYGLIGQFFVGPSPLFPSNIINSDTFQAWFGIPIQLFRAIMAVVIAIFTIRTLRAFEYNRQQTLTAARQQLQAEIAHRNALRQEYLQRIVEAQEEERTRIARELHDEFGQMLTGLAVGLRGTQISVEQPELVRQQLGQLEEMAVQALGNMRHMVNELRPALLDDMGLMAALRHHVDRFSKLTGIQATLNLSREYHRLPPNLETILFRITQEALTNVARHSQATQSWIEMNYQNGQITLQIRDDGQGFDAAGILQADKRVGWGLIGIQERVQAVNGDVMIESEVGHGTRLTITVPLEKECCG